MEQKPYAQQVVEAYAKTIQPTGRHTNDADTAFFLALRRLGRAVILVVAVLALCLLVYGCNSDKPASMQSTAAVSSLTPTPQPPTINVVRGTTFHHHTLDADIIFIGRDQNGAVITDIRVDGSQQVRVVMAADCFLTKILNNQDWKIVGLNTVKETAQ